MNILYTITAYPPSIGGAQIHTHQLAKLLSRENDVKVVSFWDRNRSDWLLGTTLFADRISNGYSIDGIRVQKIGISNIEKIMSIPFVIGYYPLMKPSIGFLSGMLKRHLHPSSTGIEILHNIRIGREPLSYASFSLAQEMEIPFVFSPLHHPRWGGWLHRFFHRLYREADALLALTSAEKNDLVALGAREDRIFITGIGPVLADKGNAGKFKETYSLNDGPIILFLGQKYAYKGISLILEATRHVWRRLPEVNFVLAGPRTQYSRELIKDYTDPRIIEIDVLDLQGKTDALDACDILCLPSSQESFGGVFTEAWWLGKPVIGGKIPAVESVISDGIDGYITQLNVNDLSEKITQLVLNTKLAREMGKNGRKKVEENYTWEKLAEKTMSAYRIAMGRQD